MPSVPTFTQRASLTYSCWPPGTDETSLPHYVDGHIYANVEGFYAKFFESKTWSPMAADIARARVETYSHNLQSREKFASWLPCLPSDLPVEKDRRYICVGEESKESTSLSSGETMVMMRPKESDRELAWAEVLVIGQIGLDGKYLNGFLRLCESARVTFACQPDRLFIHGFYIYGSGMELWLFDRAGIYSCQAFDILQNPNRFFTILIVYTSMLDEELGLGPLIKYDTHGNYIQLEDPDRPGMDRLYLDTPTIFERVNKNIVGDGLTCYRARQSSSDDWEYAIKLKWAPSGVASEVNMLERAKKRKPWGVLRLFAQQTVFSTASLHYGLGFGPRRMLRNGPPTLVDGQVESVLDHTVESPDVEPPANTTLICIAVSPLGNSLHRFQTIPQVLDSLSDAIRAHPSLYLDAGILHQDICPGNIIIPSYGTRLEANSPKGFLIDLGAAKEVSEPYKQFQSSGTPPFHAIGVLQAYLPNNPHTYRHDLESFFYTFLFLAICPGPVSPGENQLQLPATSPLRDWMQGRPVDRARRKIIDMDPVNFSRITDCFTPDFKPLINLAENLRRILFPERGAEIWTGTDMTPDGTDALYNQMIQAFDWAASEYSR